MVPPPRRNRPQSQPLTTTLANILRDYHAGGTVLRELLQNADDAGASRMDFHLCTKPLPATDSPLLHPALHDYQGPSLIAYNSHPPFLASDFESLMHLGDSLKRDDATKTGKFGLGFNSVYHWTDVPQILSDRTLLLLDPHHDWSADLGYPGGPSWDVVEDGEDEAMRNQLAVFREALGVDLKNGLAGTAVRIPLRTEDQAKASKICKNMVSVEDMKKVLDDFASGFTGGGYGVFLKTVEEIMVSVDGECVGAWKVVNRHEVQEKRRALKEAFGRVFVTSSEPHSSLRLDMEVQVNLRRTGQTEKITWLVQHFMRRKGGSQQGLIEWGRERKLFGWVAVATPVIGGFSGELFTVLPLNKPLNDQPVHIHGLFSISSDRASLHSTADKTMQDPNPSLWNEYLFDELIPKAWARLLSYICRTRSAQAIGWMFWPRNDDAMLDKLGRNVCATLLEDIRQRNLAVFPSGTKYVEARTGLFTMAEELSVELRAALAGLNLPIVYIDSSRGWVYSLLEASGEDEVRWLTPSAVCDLIRRGDYSAQLEEAPPGAKKALLEYLLSFVGNPDEEDSDGFEILYGIPLFPLEDGTYEALDADHPGIFVSRYDGEEQAFQLEPKRNLDHRSVTAQVVEVLRVVAACRDHPVHYRSRDDFLGYAKRYLFSGLSATQEVIPASPELLQSVIKAWKWIMCEFKRQLTKRTLKLPVEFGKLWLIPIRGGYLRQCVPANGPPTLHSLSGLTGALLLCLFSLQSERQDLMVFPPLLDPSVIQGKIFGYLSNYAGDLSTEALFLGTCEKLRYLVSWIAFCRVSVPRLGDDEKRLLLSIIAQKYASATQAEKEIVRSQLRQIPLFEQIQTDFISGEMEEKRTWISLKTHTSFIGIRELPFIPAGNDKTTFIYSNDKHVVDMLTTAGLASWPPEAELLEYHVVPALAVQGGCDPIPVETKSEILEILLRIYTLFSRKTQALISKLAIVQVEQGAKVPVSLEKINDKAVQGQNGDESPSFRPISDLLDPTATDIHDLYFADEILFPRRALYDTFRGAMLQCGLRSKLAWELASERIREFAKTSRSVEDVAPRVKNLLQSPIVGTPSEALVGGMKALAWVPVTIGVEDKASRGGMERVTPTCCRSSRHRLLVSHVLHVLDYEVHKTWEQLLGWNITLNKETLMKQLELGTQAGDLGVMHAVLSYVECRDGLLAECLPFLQNEIKYVQGASGKLFRPNKVFLQDASALSPYLDNLDCSFREKHPTLMRQLQIGQKPSLGDLFGVQEHLVGLEQPLDARNTETAVELARLASFHDRSLLDELMIPDREGRLRKVADTTFWDMEYWDDRETTPLAHKDISIAVAERLGIQTSSERVLMGEMGVQDHDDEDEFFQHEKTTTRIADTLSRYTADSTFNEYLANAEDCDEAERIDWLLDECRGGDYPTEKLLSKDLAPFQGQALFVHNDGVFHERDFAGFRDVGRGSKREEEFAIGQFGRGAQTMYHWTDLPMLISGKHFLVLDPQQKFLPLNRRHGRRKPGLKIELSRVRESCSDQLAPFNGLWGYSTDLDEYKGTIFRFPLRPRGSQTLLTESTQHLDFGAAKERLVAYFEIARLSLLFLQRIRHIEFSLRHEGKLVWMAEKLPPPRIDAFEPSIFQTLAISYTYTDNKRKEVAGNERWLVGKQDIPQIPGKLQGWQERVKKTPKLLHCGVAALLSQQLTTAPRRVFSTLPLPFPSNLPVHVNASFMLSGDRRSILVEKSSNNEGSAWNRWLLQEALPSLYLDLLEELVRYKCEDVFKFWPTREFSKDGLSDHIRTAFWEKLTASRNRLYPRAKSTVNVPVVKTGRRGGQREMSQKIETYELSGAKFDFLSARYSSKLQDMLRSWFPNLVRIQEDGIRKDFIRVEGASILTGGDILDIIRKADRLFGDELENFAREAPDSFDELREIILSVVVKDKDKLDGCRILPLQNGSLGTLHLLKLGPVSVTYFIVTAEEQKLFSFASELFVKDQHIQVPTSNGILTNSRTGKKFLDTLFSSPPAFNVRALTAKDIGQLLQKRVLSDWSSTPAIGAWLKDFWSYFGKAAAALENLPGSNAETLATCGVDKFPIYQATMYQKTVYISPADVELRPAIIQPTNDSHLNLCHQFPDLILINPKMMLPAKTHNSLFDFDTFSRFLKALKFFANNQNCALDTLVSTALNTSCRDTLLELTLFATATITSAPASSDKALLSIMRMLPILPTTSDQGSLYVTTQNALATDEPNLLVPWLKQRERFVEPNFLEAHMKELQVLGLSPLPHKTALFEYVFPGLPVRLQPEHYEAYTKLIDTISSKQRFPFQFTSTKLAANNECIMHYASDLLYHNDSVYGAAFPCVSSPRFLFHRIRQYHRFWLRQGLRGGRDNAIPRSEYLECLRSLEAQTKEAQTASQFPPSLLVNIQSTLAGLERVQGLNPENDETSKEIFSLCIVPTNGEISREPAFRRVAMQALHDSHKLISLAEVTYGVHAPCCWTQVPFPSLSLRLPEETLERLQLRGRPSVSTVWDHLRSLVHVSEGLQGDEVRSFISDLSQTYRYLRENTADLPTVPGLDQERIWLNIDYDTMSLTPNPPAARQIQAAWMDVSHLLLFSPYDPGEMQSVRSFLMPYEDLLKRCGCRPIRHPTLRKPETRGPTSGPTLTEIAKLWKAQQMTDITFSAGGKTIGAHKVVLAAVSEMWKGRFHGGWAQSGNGGPISLDADDISYETLEILLEFAYYDDLNWAPMELHEDDSMDAVADKLDALLDLLTAADQWIMQRFHGLVEEYILDRARKFIRIDNVRRVARAADKANAKELKGLCMDYCEENSAVMTVVDRESD